MPSFLSSKEHFRGQKKEENPHSRAFQVCIWNIYFRKYIFNTLSFIQKETNFSGGT